MATPLIELVYCAQPLTIAVVAKAVPLTALSAIAILSLAQPLMATPLTELVYCAQPLIDTPLAELARTFQDFASPPPPAWS